MTVYFLIVDVPEQIIWREQMLLASHKRERYNRLVRLHVAFFWLIQAALPIIAQDVSIQCVAPNAATGVSKAVVVDGKLSLLYTSQLFALHERQEKTGQDVQKQTEQVLDKLGLILFTAGSDLGKVAKLNIYLTQAEALPEIYKVLAQRLAGPIKPAANFVVTTLPIKGALVAMDAVAITPSGDEQGVTKLFAVSEASLHGGISDGAILPPGSRIYVSGMADTNSLPEATKRTLEKLTAAIGHLGPQKSDIVQLKVFLQPMSEVPAVRKIIEDFFGGTAPPTIFVEWISPTPNPPIEIELIAGGKSAATKESETVTFLTPPGTTSTKVFSRVAQINRGKLVYISGLYGLKAQTPRDEVREIFQSLGEVLKNTGSDFEHLVKATYYVSDDSAGDKLNEIRPEFYNPLRPPAASKAKVKGVAEQGKTVSVDMIAVTK